MKDHIHRLPVVDFTETVGHTPSHSPTAVSIPLFGSSFQFIKDSNTLDRFRNIHCKGAIWTAIAFAKNTDLVENKIPVYFHIEASVWNKAQPVFKEFNVPDDFIRVVTFEKGAFPRSRVQNVRYGKKLMCFFDDLDPMPTNWIIADSDCFPCTTGPLMKLHKVLTSKAVINHPASIEYRWIEFNKEHWIHRICDAAGVVYKEGITEGQILKKLKLGVLLETTSDVVIRPRCKTTLISIPTQHLIVDYIRNHFFRCCEDEFLLACFSLWSPFVDLSSMIDVPIPLSPQEYSATQADTYFHHLIFESENANAYFTRFYQDLTRHLTEETPYIEAFQTLHAK